ncbi:hypothetical protein [Alkalinema sp. FACHB-956]|uniref:hypothetical protein n=1 Tax=Alkalinema sp. FACHB-956 TaxID=2692768 RepID=UPI0016857F72|nr:hypothetical protein [Alkalinema sp. FACHB-956]MBD2330140.1 hypothetical protein [Alkalinema sp. FACHB-956]
MEPKHLDQYFPWNRQKYYVSTLQRRGGLTLRRAECLVRLWAYLLLKESQNQGLLPEISLANLGPQQDFVACTHREAAELFYANRDRGSDRAAGLMLDRLASLGVLDKRFDGQTLCIKIRSTPDLLTPRKEQEEIPELFADAFNPRTDAVPAAQLLTRTYAELVKDPAATSYKITKNLRAWAENYSPCMRVLRRVDNLNPVGIVVLYPVTSESEVHFFYPPSKGFFLTTDRPIDPFVMAQAGDPSCTSIYVRGWTIDPLYFNHQTLKQLIQDTQATLHRMKEDFPALCDLYSMIIHPSYEELRRLMGFERVSQDMQRPYSWVYVSIDRYLGFNAVDIVNALASS